MNSRRIVWLALFLILTVFTACTAPETEAEVPNSFYKNGIDPQTMPLRVTEDLYPDPPYGTMQRRIGLAGQDLTRHDFSVVRAAILAGSSFDTRTRWPLSDQLPEDFDSEKWLDSARNPGLGVGYLHSQGYDGQGWSVAILGGPILTGHEEFSENTQFHIPGNFSAGKDDTAYQGMVTASILAGSTCGITPAAKLHYYAVLQGPEVFVRYGQAMESIVAFNQEQPVGERIRLVVISDGLSPEDEGWDLWQEQVDSAQREGVYVLYANNAAEKGFFWGGCPPYKDRDQSGNYEPAGILRGGAIEEGGVLVPGDYRTTALHTGSDVYIYWADGGFSWAIPYLGGLCLMAWEIAPELSLDELLDLMQETADTTDFEWRVLNPVRFIFALESVDQS